MELNYKTAHIPAHLCFAYELGLICLILYKKKSATTRKLKVAASLMRLVAGTNYDMGYRLSRPAHAREWHCLTTKKKTIQTFSYAFYAYMKTERHA